MTPTHATIVNLQADFSDEKNAVWRQVPTWRLSVN